MATCPPCTDAINAWYDTTPRIVSPGVRIGGSGGYDDTVAGAAGNRRARYDRWASLVRNQTALIREGCRAGRHADPRPEGDD